MRHYIPRIIDIFARSDTPPELTEEIHRWMANGHFQEEKESALHQLWKQASNRASRVMSRRNSWGNLAKTATLAAVMAGLTFLLSRHKSPENNILSEALTPYQATRTWHLPDGSIVQTNAGTILLYPKQFAKDSRTVYLVGEADFKVAKNPKKPFSVHAGGMTVRALGTEFNVNAYPQNNNLCASLIRGKVQVNYNQDQYRHLLMPGQELVFDRLHGRSFVRAADLETVTAWQKGGLVFHNMQMPEILVALQRRYGIRFQYDGSLFGTDRYNFEFKQQAALPRVLDIIAQVSGGFRYHFSDESCFMTKK